MSYDLFGGNDLHLASQGKELYWFDVRHMDDPGSPMFGRIENALAEFQPDLVLVEGGYDSFEGDRESAILDGESAFAAYLAKEAGIPVMDIGPPFPRQIEYLQSRHPPDAVLAMYLVRQISSKHYSSDNSQVDFEEMLMGMRDSLVADGLEYSGTTLEATLDTINGYLPQPIDAGNWRDVDIREMNYIYTRENGILYPVYNDTYHFRNSYLVGLIEERKQDYDKVFL